MRALFIALLLLCALPLHAAKFYKWVDKEGVVHYDATPPKDQKTTEVRASDRSGAAPAEPATDPAAETGDAAAEPVETPDQTACKSARENLKTLQSSPTIMRPGKDGMNVKLSMEEVEAAYKEAGEQIAQYCEPTG